MRKASRVPMLATTLLLAACGQTVKLQTPFDPVKAAYIHTKGRAAITGQAFLRRNDGVVVYAAGSEVQLTPVTDYAWERIRAIYGDRKMRAIIGGAVTFEGDDPAYRQYMRTVKANGEGRFVFSEVGPGAYFVTTTVHWCAPSQYGCIPQGGHLMDRLTIAGAEKADVILNGE